MPDLKFISKASIVPLEDAEYAQKIRSILQIPEGSEKQPDLTYVKSVLVSSGLNANGAYFLPSELVKASDTINNKPFDIEHIDVGVVGHLCTSSIIDFEGNVLDVEQLRSLPTEELDKRDIEIVTLGVVYNQRFSDVVEDIIDGKYAVSMECYYSHFDVMLGDYVLPFSESSAKDDGSFETECAVSYGDIDLGSVKIARILRNLHFGGCAFVEQPANERSLIYEVAAKKELDSSTSDDASLSDEEIYDYTVNIELMPLSLIEKSSALLSLVHANKEVSFAIYTGAHSHTIYDEASGKSLDGGHGHGVLHENTDKWRYLEVYDGGFHKHSIVSDGMKTKPENEHTHIVLVEDYAGNSKLIETSGPVKSHTHEILDQNSTTYGGSHSHYITLPDGKKIRTVYGKRSLNKFLNETQNSFDMSEVSTTLSAERCVNYKRYVYDFKGDSYDSSVGEDVPVPAPPMPDGPNNWFGDIELKHTNWCNLFDTECPTYADAKHPDCLRNVLNTTTREVVSNFKDKLLENRGRLSKISTELSKLLSKTKKQI